MGVTYTFNAHMERILFQSNGGLQTKHSNHVRLNNSGLPYGYTELYSSPGFYAQTVKRGRAKQQGAHLSVQVVNCGSPFDMSLTKASERGIAPSSGSTRLSLIW